MNTQEMIRDLVGLCPDVGLLGWTGILCKEAINIPRMGFINGHTGLLPWIRGRGAIPRAIIRGIPIGVTCHFVNERADTGPIIQRRLLEVKGNNTTSTEIVENTQSLAAHAVAELCRDLIAGKELEAVEQKVVYPPCIPIVGAERRFLDQLIKQGYPRIAFERWKSCCDNSDFILPKGFHAFPGE